MKQAQCTSRIPTPAHVYQRLLRDTISLLGEAHTNKGSTAGEQMLEQFLEHQPPPRK